MKMPHTTIWLTKDLYVLVKKKCDENNCSEGSLIREALKKYLGVEDNERGDEKAVGYDKPEYPDFVKALLGEGEGKRG
jgi:hypothetical protein